MTSLARYLFHAMFRGPIPDHPAFVEACRRRTRTSGRPATGPSAANTTPDQARAFRYRTGLAAEAVERAVQRALPGDPVPPRRSSTSSGRSSRRRRPGTTSTAAASTATSARGSG
ncbi:hypothetical protein [Actinoplanes missouriensis]|uniref:hypothetical protein n=1 Tax=Actinoplanes missouriensis TaxID=1866 RepID=UPI0012FC0B90|nr:hypothetical protein [Actinoplanes missouriensis]